MSAHQDSAVDVLGCDRDAASPFMDRYLDGSSITDDRGNLAKAFARHRIEATATLREQRDELLEALERLHGTVQSAIDAGLFLSAGGKKPEIMAMDAAASSIAKARGAS